MSDNPYKKLAKRLDTLPNGFPETNNGVELRLLSKLFSPEEAWLAAQLRLTPETPEELAQRLERGTTSYDTATLKSTLKSMARRGLIAVHRTQAGIAYGLMPFVVGIYEMQIGRIDAELATLFEEYYQQAFGVMLSYQPKFHRVVPIGETIQMDMEVRPYESATEILRAAKAWGVVPCICRTQKALIGEACEHPVDTCMILSQTPNAFDNNPSIRALTIQDAEHVLHRAASSGLVHTVSNNQKGTSYICNCCTCSCGLLRGMAELGIANVVARSAFVNQVDNDRCMACETCMDYCQFGALSLDDGVMRVDEQRCVGCGICVPACPEGALYLLRRPEGEVLPPPVSETEWAMQRAEARGLDIGEVL